METQQLMLIVDYNKFNSDDLGNNQTSLDVCKFCKFFPIVPDPPVTNIFI